MANDTERRALSAAALYKQKRGGGAITQLVNQRLGSYVGVVAVRLRLRPRTLTLMNPLCAGLTCAAAFALAVPGESHAAAGVIFGTGLCVAYSFDCADGQVARATGQASRAGAVLDVICDFLAQAPAYGLVALIAAANAPTPPLFLLLAAVVLPVGSLLLATAMHAGEVVSRSPRQEGGRQFLSPIVRLAQDYGLHLLLLALAISLNGVYPLVALVLLIGLHAGLIGARVLILFRQSVPYVP